MSRSFGCPNSNALGLHKVSSGGMYGQELPGSDLQSERTSYGPKKLYGRTKREQVVITEQWALRLKGSGVVVPYASRCSREPASQPTPSSPHNVRWTERSSKEMTGSCAFS
jgi:hypothetical protein